MLCHSKVWSRVWSHRCNVNMNPYISVCPFACLCFLSRFTLFQSLSLPSIDQPSPLLSRFCFHLRRFRQALQKGGYVTSPCSVKPSASIPLDLSSIFSPLSALPICILLYSSTSQDLRTPSSLQVTEMYERNCIYCLLFVPAKLMRIGFPG